MFKQVLSSIVAFALTLSIGSAFASVDVNTANADALRGIKGIGPAKTKSILDERQAHRPFKDAADLGTRVKTVQCLEAEGLTGRLPKQPPYRVAAVRCARRKCCRHRRSRSS